MNISNPCTLLDCFPGSVCVAYNETGTCECLDGYLPVDNGRLCSKVEIGMLVLWGINLAIQIVALVAITFTFIFRLFWNRQSLSMKSLGRVLLHYIANTTLHWLIGVNAILKFLYPKSFIAGESFFTTWCICTCVSIAGCMPLVLIQKYCNYLEAKQVEILQLQSKNLNALTRVRGVLHNVAANRNFVRGLMAGIVIVCGVDPYLIFIEGVRKVDVLNYINFIGFIMTPLIAFQILVTSGPILKDLDTMVKLELALLSGGESSEQRDISRILKRTKPAMQQLRFHRGVALFHGSVVSIGLLAVMVIPQLQSTNEPYVSSYVEYVGVGLFFPLISLEFLIYYLLRFKFLKSKLRPAPYSSSANPGKVAPESDRLSQSMLSESIVKKKPKSRN